MEIKLYLKKINQEMIDTGRKLSPDKIAKCDFYVSWEKSCCILDFFIQNPDELVSFPLRQGLIMRKEDVGGLIWDARTGAVYQVDEEAYHTIIELDHGLNELEVARRMQVPLSRVKSLRSQLGKLASV